MTLEVLISKLRRIFILFILVVRDEMELLIVDLNTHDHELVIPEKPEPISDDKREESNEN